MTVFQRRDLLRRDRGELQLIVPEGAADKQRHDDLAAHGEVPPQSRHQDVRFLGDADHDFVLRARRLARDRRPADPKESPRRENRRQRPPEPAHGFTPQIFGHPDRHHLDQTLTRAEARTLSLLATAFAALLAGPRVNHRRPRYGRSRAYSTV